MEDMSDIIQKMSEMLKSNEVPDNIKSIMNNISSSSQFDSDASSTHAERPNFEQTHKENDNGENCFSDMPNIDLNTMLKMKTIIDSMNSQQNDPRANLLRSLKPYLKTSRRNKVDQYIKLFSMGKVFEVLNPLGGDNKNDI